MTAWQEQWRPKTDEEWAGRARMARARIEGYASMLTRLEEARAADDPDPEMVAAYEVWIADLELDDIDREALDR